MEKNNVKKRRKTLKTAENCRLFLSKIINEIYNSEIEIDRGRALIYGISTLIKAIEIGEIEQRISELERIMEGKKL